MAAHTESLAELSEAFCLGRCLFALRCTGLLVGHPPRTSDPKHKIPSMARRHGSDCAAQSSSAMAINAPRLIARQWTEAGVVV